VAPRPAHRLPSGAPLVQRPEAGTTPS